MLKIPEYHQTKCTQLHRPVHHSYTHSDTLEPDHDHLFLKVFRLFQTKLLTDNFQHHDHESISKDSIKVSYL